MIDLKQLRGLTKELEVLYVEDDPGIRKELASYLEKIFKSVQTAENGQIGFEMYKAGKFDIILTDISMPLMDGLEMSRKIRQDDFDQEIIIISAYSYSEYFIDSIKIGVSGYIIKPVDYEQIKEVLYKSAAKINAIREAEHYKNNLEDMVSERTEELKKALEIEKQLQADRIDNYQKTITSFIDMIERRDTYTAGHSQRVAEYSKMIAQEMGYSKEECENLFQAAILHDIGKVATPDSILLKPGKLNSLEYNLIQEHVLTSYILLKNIPMYTELAEIIYYHHERYDGKGYPNGKKGDEIPPLSRIMMVADAFDAMTTNRIYKARKSIGDAIEELEKLKNIQFHADVVEAALKVLSNLEIDYNINQLPKTTLEKERFAYFFKDTITNSYSKSYLELILNNNLSEKVYHYMYGLFISKFSEYNNLFGWDKGDEFLAEVADSLIEKFPDSLLFRIHGDDFIILSTKELNINTAVEIISDKTPKSCGIEIQGKEYNIDNIQAEDMKNIESLQ